MWTVSELGLGTTIKLHHHGPGSSGRAGEEKTCNARARTDRGHGQRGCWLHAVGRLAFPMQHCEKKTGWSEMPTHFALWCVSYRLPLPLPHIFYLDDVPCSGPHFLIWLKARGFLSWSHIWPMQQSACPFICLISRHFILFQPLPLSPSLPPSLICSLFRRHRLARNFSDGTSFVRCPSDESDRPVLDRSPFRPNKIQNELNNIF